MDPELQTLVGNWIRWDTSADSRAEIIRLVDEKRYPELGAIMRPRIAFGTAGLRGKMGPGFACMNTVTVYQASQGLAMYCREQVNDALMRGVVVGHDHRHHSSEFAKLVEQAFVAKGYKVYSLGQVPTPFVALGVTYHKAAVGVMITASHNPAQDNGYKVYWGNGCQIIPPHDTGISEAILANQDPWPEVELIGVYRGAEEVRKAWMASLKPITFATDLSKLKIVYTPMHGVGLHDAKAALKQLCIEPIIVAEQAVQDPDFSTVAFPNPEEAGALDLSYKWGSENGADIVFANDPDADRFACAIFECGKWVRLTGDEVGTLFADYLLRRTSSIPNRAVLNSTVSSRRLEALATHYHCKFFETLTGFKWLGNKALDLRQQGMVVPFAYEEALGYMVDPQITDKDGISALYVFAQLIAELGGSAAKVRARLNELGDKMGHFATFNSYYRTMSQDVTPHIFSLIRSNPQFRVQIGDFKVTRWRDLTIGWDSGTADHKPLLPVSKNTEMITADLLIDQGVTARFTVRGSGTEPKLKIYIESRAPSAERAAAAAKDVWDTLASCWFHDSGLGVA